MEQIKRIMYMEENLDEISMAVRGLTNALKNYEDIRARLQELSDYYESPLWRRDFEDDEAGKLPTDLKRGVLSEDSVYNLLDENRELLTRMQNLINEL